MSGVRDYQCWPDESGERAVVRHKCTNGYVTSTLPKGARGGATGWYFDGEKVTPSVRCLLCGFHMMIVKTHDAPPGDV